MSRQWEKVRLGEVVAPAVRAETPIAGIVYRQIGVKLWGVGAYERETMDGVQTKYKQLFRAETGDIIVNKIWARNGSVAVVPESLAGCYGSGEFPMFAPNQNRLEPRWIHWLTKTRGFWMQCDEKSQGTSGKNRIRPEQFLRVEIPLPPLSEQRRIVARIEDLAGQIQEARNLRQKAAEEAEVFFDSYKNNTFTSNQLKKWRVRFEDTDLILNKETRNPLLSEKNEEILYIDITTIGRGPTIATTGKSILSHNAPSRARRVIHANDIIISTVRPNLRAFAKVDPRLHNQICSTGFAVITCGPLINPDYLLHQFCSPFFIDQCIKLTRGGHYPAINEKNLKIVEIVVPPLPEQRRIVAELEALQAKVDSLKRLQAETSAELDSLLPAILDRAFKGEL